MQTENMSVIELIPSEYNTCSGGIILTAITVFSGICLLSAGAGYVYGKLTCNCKE
jgi:hypothetical protein